MIVTFSLRRSPRDRSAFAIFLVAGAAAREWVAISGELPRAARKFSVV